MSSSKAVIRGAGETHRLEATGGTSASFPPPLPTGTEPRTGLFLVAQPSSQQQISLDIIAVHGLNGDIINTWTSTKTGTFWLKDLLPQYFPQARILSYGWDAVVSGVSTTSSVFSRNAEYLLYQIKNSRQGIVDNQRPVIFLAHSVGGLLVKQAIVNASFRPKSFLYLSSCAILFFGTPHNGSSAASYGLVSTEKAKAFHTRTDVPPLWMESIKKNAFTLQSLSNSFRYVSPNLELATFYETVPTKVGGTGYVLVDTSSTKMNLPNELQFALSASHNDLCRYDGPEDRNFKVVLHVIRDFSQNILQHISSSAEIHSRPPPSPASTESPNEYLLNVDIFLLNKSRESGRKLITNSTKSITSFLSDGFKDVLDRMDLPSFDDEPLSEPSNAPREETDLIESMAWIHVPVNNTQWVHDCLMQVAAPLGLNLSITKSEFWINNETKGKNDIPHSRSMIPSVFFDISGADIDENTNLRSCKQLALYLPYINWDTTACFQKRDNYIRSVYQKKLALIPTGLGEQARSVYIIIRDFLNLGASFHPRRSLDQFFYSRLPDTSSRDKDQIISKYTGGSEGGAKMIMVDQLWLWIIDARDSTTGPSTRTTDSKDTLILQNERKPDSTLVTFFPEKDSEGNEDKIYPLGNLKQGIADRITDSNNKYSSAWPLAAIAIKEAMNVMLEVRYESLNFLEIFREAIGDASEQQTQFFRRFRDALNNPSGLENSRAQKVEEMKLVLEVADIIDELNTLTRLFDVQRDTLDEALPIFQQNEQMDRCDDNKSAVEILRESIKDVEGYRIQIKRMGEDAERTYQSLLSLLDLQQKETNIDEAHVAAEQLVHAREQADATSTQSQILFLFTFVTIIFLPLSFFTSYFGMNVIEQTGQAGEQTVRHVWTIMGPASAGIIMLCLTISIIVYLRRTWKLEKKQDENDERFNNAPDVVLSAENGTHGSSSDSSLWKRRKRNQRGDDEENGRKG